MAFESLSYSHDIFLSDFPEKWIPLVYLYDPDLPLFPLQYFHVLDPALPTGYRAGETDRAYGYIQSVDRTSNGFVARICLNKNLQDARFELLRKAVESEVRERLGLNNPVTVKDIENAFTGEMAKNNPIVKELWYKVVDRSFGQSLPFGRIWDGVLGLSRFVASWYSSGGRKGELIQTHSFVSDFGVPVQSSSGFNVDFYLLPTFSELTDSDNPLSLFPQFRNLLKAAQFFCETYCTVKSAGESAKFSHFLLKEHGGGRLDTEWILRMVNAAPAECQNVLFKNYGGFDRGPQRSIIYLMMLNDLRLGFWHPTRLGLQECKHLYDQLDGSYQSPKVIHLFSQQCFGNPYVLPIDNWIRTFLEHPFCFVPKQKKSHDSEIFDYCERWGRVERLLWLVAQARKVHSSVCADILWCIRFGGQDKIMRGANPLSCKICSEVIRDGCFGFQNILQQTISFNRSPKQLTCHFNIVTSARNNKLPGQSIARCESANTCDEYSCRDMPLKFRPFPAAGHNGNPMTVNDFISRY